MKSDSDLLKAFRFFRRNPIGAGVYPCPRDWQGMAPAALALQAARDNVESLPGLQAALAAALAALAAPLDLSAELAALGGAERAIGAAMGVERAAAEDYQGGKGPLADYGPLAAAMKARRVAACQLEEARKGLQSAEKREGQKAAAKRAKEVLSHATRFRNSAPVWNRAGPWHGPQSSGPGLVYFEKPGAFFRNIKEASGVGGRYNPLNIPAGYYGDSDCGNLCRAFVLQLRGRKGRAFFVPGYQFEGSYNGGIVVDLSPRAIESAPGGDWEAAEREAALAADQLAESHAEAEREYQEAWRAGADWAELKEEEEEERIQALAILAERRAASELNPAGFPAICEALRGQVIKARRAIAKSRAKRAGLVDSIYGKEGRAAFCEGAEPAAFPS